jgi:hypothetical protein
VCGQESLAEKDGEDALSVGAFAYDIFMNQLNNKEILHATLTVFWAETSLRFLPLHN